MISKLETKHLGSYKCVGKSTNRSNSTLLYSIEKLNNSDVIGRVQAHIFEVYDKPKIRLDFQTQIENIAENDEIRIKCSSSNPKFKIEWYQDNEALGTDLLMLKTDNVLEFDFYKCFVTDTDRKVISSVAVRFSEKLPRVFQLALENVQKQEFSEFSTGFGDKIEEMVKEDDNIDIGDEDSYLNDFKNKISMKINLD